MHVDCPESVLKREKVLRNMDAQSTRTSLIKFKNFIEWEILYPSNPLKKFFWSSRGSIKQSLVQTQSGEIQSIEGIELICFSFSCIFNAVSVTCAGL